MVVMDPHCLSWARALLELLEGDSLRGWGWPGFSPPPHLAKRLVLPFVAFLLWLRHRHLPELRGSVADLGDPK